MDKIIIRGTLPGANEYIDANRRAKFAAAKMKRQAEDVVKAAAKRLRRKYDGPVFLRYTWYEPNRRRDKDNVVFAQKFIQDGLVHAGVLKGDGWRYVRGFEHVVELDKTNPRVEVEIIELED